MPSLGSHRAACKGVSSFHLAARVEQSLLAESWNPAYVALGFDPDAAEPPFLKAAVDELAGTDLQG